MTFDELKAKIKLAGYDCHPSKRSKKVIIVETAPKMDRHSILKEEILPIVNGRWLQPNQLKSTAKSSAGGVQCGDFVIIAKALVKGTSLSAIDARMFTKGAKRVTIAIGTDLVPCFQFTSAKQIEDAIVAGLKTEALFGNAAESLRVFFEGHDLVWGKFEPPHVLNQIGVYVGELLIGWVIMKGLVSKHISGANPFPKNPARFLIPDDPSYASVDSFIEDKEGTLVAISSKFGRGAKGSLITAVMPAAMQRKIKGKTLAEMVAASKRVGVYNFTKAASDIIYEWGANTLLKLNIKRPRKIIDEMASGKLSQDSLRIIGAVETAMRKAGMREVKNLPHATSFFFTKTLAERLNKDSVDDILSILSAKDYYQVNLDKRAFLDRSEIKFACRKAGSSKITIIGSKAGSMDIRMKQGWINFEVKLT